MTTRKILYLVSHPIQYQAPLLRRITAESDIRLRVLFHHDTEAGYFDPGFGRHIQWDIPLRQGYDSALLTETDLEQEISATDYLWMHGWQGQWLRQALKLARRHGKPVLMRGENTTVAMPDGSGLKGVAKRLYLRWIFAHVTAFLAIGSDNHDYYRAHGVAADRIFMMPYAIDSQAFAIRAAKTDRQDLRRRLALDENRAIILYAGKLIARKHPHTLLQAWRMASWADAERPFLLFAGDGEMRSQLMVQAGDDDKVRFIGFVNQQELPSLYALADLFVLASEAEPWGLAVNEAMACGTAVIVGDRAGCAADLINEDCGIVVPPGDANALARAMVELLPKASQCGQAAARRSAGWNFEADVTGLRQCLDWLEKRPCA